VINKTHTFRVDINFDAEVNKWYVSDTEMPGLILEEANPGRLLDRLRIAAHDLLKARKGGYSMDLGIADGDIVALNPVFQPIVIGD
jgi:Domain of unknown function (DUF1902)